MAARRRRRAAASKPLLYTFRVLLTGIHLMRTGEVVADLTRLYDGGPPYLPELVEAKRSAEHGLLPADAPGFGTLESDVRRLNGTLRAAADSTRLPDAPTARRALHDLLVRTRLDPPPAPRVRHPGTAGAGRG